MNKIWSWIGREASQLAAAGAGAIQLLSLLLHLLKITMYPQHLLCKLLLSKELLLPLNLTLMPTRNNKPRRKENSLSSKRRSPKKPKWLLEALQILNMKVTLVGT